MVRLLQPGLSVGRQVMQSGSQPALHPVGTALPYQGVMASALPTQPGWTCQTRRQGQEEWDGSERSHFSSHNTPPKLRDFYLHGSGYSSLWAATRSCGLGTNVPGMFTEGLMSMWERSLSFLHVPSYLSGAAPQRTHALRLYVVKYGLCCLSSGGTVLTLAPVCTDWRSLSLLVCWRPWQTWVFLPDNAAGSSCATQCFWHVASWEHTCGGLGFVCFFFF